MEKQKEIGTLIKSYTMKRTTPSKEKFDIVVLWYRDVNGEKQMKVYDRPLMDYYIIKDKNSEEAKFPPLYIDIDKVEKKSVPSHQITKAIAMDTGTLDWVNKYRMTKGENAPEIKNVFRHNHVYSGDIDVTDYCMMDFLDNHSPNPNYELHKAYFDIEVDQATVNKDGTITYYDSFPHQDKAPCPINVISLCDGKNKIVYSFLLRDNTNQSVIDFENNISKKRQEILDKLKNEYKYDANALVFKFYDSELELIQGFMEKVHSIDPDFLLAWNMIFDVDTIINRLKKIVTVELFGEYCGREVKKLSDWDLKEFVDKIMTNPKYTNGYTHNGDLITIPTNTYYNSELKRKMSMKKGNNDKRIDTFNVLDGTNWMDQMLYYKVCGDAGGKKPNYNLDFIAEIETGVGKVKMERHESVVNLARTNWDKFILYACVDVTSQSNIEDNKMHFDQIQQLSEILNTRKEKVYNNSISVANLFRVFSKAIGKVMNSNKNMSYKPWESEAERDSKTFLEQLASDPGRVFDSIYRTSRVIVEHDKIYSDLHNTRDRIGAFVSDPNLLERAGHEVMPGIMSMFIWRLLVDFDLTSLYPSIIIAFNIDPTTLVGKFYWRDDMLKERLKKDFDHYGCFKVSDKSNGGEEEDDEIEMYDEDENRLTVEVETVVEMNDLAPTLVDKIISQNWSGLAEQLMCFKSTESMFDDIDKLIEERE